MRLPLAAHVSLMRVPQVQIVFEHMRHGQVDSVQRRGPGNKQDRGGTGVVGWHTRARHVGFDTIIHSSRVGCLDDSLTAWTRRRETRNARIRMEGTLEIG